MLSNNYSGNHNKPELNLPWKVYFFNKDGQYDKQDIITITSLSMSELLNNGFVKDHIKQGLELRVCDCLDYCIMHFKDGKRIFPI